MRQIMDQCRTLKGRRSKARRGSATVEFAVMLPVFIALVMTAAQTSFSVDTAHSLYASIRQGGRLASMESDDLLLPGQTLNQKIIQDIRNQLIAEGLPGDQMTITITEADSNAEFDLSDADNDLGLFRIKVSVPFSAMNSVGAFPTAGMSDFQASIVFRKGKQSLVN